MRSFPFLDVDDLKRFRGRRLANPKRRKLNIVLDSSYKAAPDSRLQRAIVAN